MPSLSQLISIFFTLSLGVLSGFLAGSGNTIWYQSLQKPLLHPPSWIFGPVWTVLYIMLGLAFLEIKRHHSRYLLLFCLQFMFNFIWSPLFFRFHLSLWALFDLSLLLMLNLYLLFRLKSHKKIFFLLLPYNLWLCFACYLNASIVFLNYSH